LSADRLGVEQVLTLILLILLVFGLLVDGLCKVAADADEQARRDYGLLLKLKRNVRT